MLKPADFSDGFVFKRCFVFAQHDNSNTNCFILAARL